MLTDNKSSAGMLNNVEQSHFFCHFWRVATARLILVPIQPMRIYVAGIVENLIKRMSDCRLTLYQI